MNVSRRERSAAFVRLLVIAAALCSFAQHVDAKKKNDDTRPQKERPFIAEAKVIAPQRVGEFLLEGARRYDERNKFGGVSFRYQHPDFPQLRIDLFVYPIGMGDAEEALDSGMRDFSASMKPAVDAGLYRNMIEGETIEFDLELPLSDPKGGKTVSPEDAENEKTAEQSAEIGIEDAKTSERGARLAKLLSAGKHIDGRRMGLSYDYRGDAPDEWYPMRSRMYLFYRQLHYFKGRISAATSQIDEASFAAFTDRAMRELVPAVQAYNIGDCGNSTIYVNVDAPKEKAAEDLMRSLIEVSERNARNNCHGAADEGELVRLGRDAMVETFVYSVDDWKAP